MLGYRTVVYSLSVEIQLHLFPLPVYPTTIIFSAGGLYVLKIVLNMIELSHQKRFWIYCVAKIMISLCKGTLSCPYTNMLFIHRPGNGTFFMVKCRNVIQSQPIFTF